MSAIVIAFIGAFGSSDIQKPASVPFTTQEARS
jgi:hypothetical protein